MSKATELLGLAELPKEQESSKKDSILLPLSKADKQKAIASTIKALNKESANLIQSMGKRVGQRLPSIPTNLVSVDEELIGCGGVPRGRIVEIFGPEASGKTTIALHVVAETQKAGGIGAYIDAEHSLDPTYAARIGVDVDNLIISQPDFGEQALEVADALVKTRACDVIVIDSVSALVPRAELEGDMGDAQMGLQARLMSQALRKLTAQCSKNGVTLIFINQIREKLGVMFGDPETTTGGRALKFYASLRIKIRQLSKGDGGIIEDEEKRRIGQRCRLVAVKNKAGGAPYSTTDITLLYGQGWDKKTDLIDYAVKLGILTKSGGYYIWENERYLKKSLTDDETSARLFVVVKKTIEERNKAIQEKNNELS